MASPNKKAFSALLMDLQEEVYPRIHQNVSIFHRLRVLHFTFFCEELGRIPVQSSIYIYIILSVRLTCSTEY